MTFHIPKSFVWFIQFFLDKTATSLNSSANVADPCHAVFLNCTQQHIVWLINNGYAVIAFLPFSIAFVDVDEVCAGSDYSIPTASSVVPSVQFQYNVRVTSSADVLHQNTLLLQSALARALRAVEDMSQAGFIINSMLKGQWMCFPLLVSNCCDIVEAKNVSTVKHGLSVNTPRNRCLAFVDDFDRTSKFTLRDRHSTENLSIHLKTTNSWLIVMEKAETLTKSHSKDSFRRFS